MFETIANTTSLLGECPLWCDITHRLFWTDIPNCELLALAPSSGQVQRWALPEPLGSFALTADSDVLLLGLASCLGYFNLVTGSFSKIADTPGVSGTRINDGRCDREGNFVFSTMDTGEPVQPVGQFHRLNASSLETETLNLPSVKIPNSICFSPDGATLYYADSLQGRIFCCDYPSLNNSREFTTIVGPGAPDGSTIDNEGFLWNAEWGGSRVVRYAPDGTPDRVIETPGTQTTCPVFAGLDHALLYCTTARIGLAAPTESDGALIRGVLTTTSGLPETRFAGSLG
ncbi:MULTISPECIES: SMP-30/gluconolactonase/LRE family protein [unclassified Pseudomonas]|uniref:SMP-30/gluconolactonase/LRE family protein n=1 Tax=unclassified Pseudomonas TaxID=196821 RepID=UPI0009D9065B|nr:MULTISPECIES: SMP-30/gluconolactonase/LRE family protein [unclassified Pseudomonas]PXX64532.1 L-arabinonolactonase [Pseudomonas sp. LAIL14HWK12:I1]SMD12408.1 L-arabinonolactonase [Pseudomonas sp. URIL14HWK12:I5]SOC98450.1 L-arabinonolactonase [Pseudomonas sp. LAIL14HWK12:I3]